LGKEYGTPVVFVGSDSTVVIVEALVMAAIWYGRPLTVITNPGPQPEAPSVALYGKGAPEASVIVFPKVVTVPVWPKG
jgi:hypothetical protein